MRGGGGVGEGRADDAEGLRDQLTAAVGVAVVQRLQQRLELHRIVLHAVAAGGEVLGRAGAVDLQQAEALLVVVRAHDIDARHGLVDEELREREGRHRAPRPGVRQQGRAAPPSVRAAMQL